MGYLDAYLEATKHEEKVEKINVESEVNKRVIEAKDQLKEPYKQSIKNILTSDTLRCEINKGLKADTPIEEILDKALKCISLMTTDELFYRNNSKALKERIEKRGAKV